MNEDLKKLLDEVIGDDDSVSIEIKKLDDDEIEDLLDEAFDDDECEGCDKDCCPLNGEDDIDDKGIGTFDDFIEFILSKDADEEDEDEMETYEADAKKAYLEAVEEHGQEKADALLKICAAEANILAAMEEKLPLRDKDIKAYNDALGILVDQPSFLVEMKYYLIDRANKKSTDELKK